MKLRPLPEIDLARIAPQPTEMKWSMLRSFKTGGGSWSYQPAREQVFNIFNPANPMGLRLREPSLAQIESQIRKSCRIDAQESACIEVTRLLWQWAQENAGPAVEKPQSSMAIGSIASVRYWGNFAFLHRDRPTFVFLDHRRGTRLTKVGLRFAMSMMHQHLRLPDPDFSEAGLLVLQFPAPGRDERIIVENWDSQFELYRFDELQEMVTETYDIWRAINEERVSSERRRAAGDDWWGS